MPAARPPRGLPALLLALPLLGVGSCLTGPQTLTRSWDGWVEARTEENEALHGTVFQSVVPVYPLVGAVLGLSDFVVANPIAFWTGADEDEAPAEPAEDQAPPEPSRS